MCLALEAENIAARPVWKPMHLQPVFAGCEVTLPRPLPTREEVALLRRYAVMASACRRGPV